MLRVVGASSLEALVDEVIPAAIRVRAPLNLPGPEDEQHFLSRLAHIADQNQVHRSYIGLGYFDTFTPSVILRMVLENPAWYTPYTPYQAEIAQGRLESLLNFQTMVADLTAMDVANASLLDEATAAAEAMLLLHRVGRRSASTPAVCLVSDGCLPQTLDVLRARAEPIGIELRVGSADGMAIGPDVFGVLLQYPDASGELRDLTECIRRAHEAGARVAVGADLLALALVTPPGEMGADVVYGSAQRFGVPLGYGGPHAAFFATRHAFVRQMPGRLVGVSHDAQGQQAYRMALAAREQHIRRERATSNICTAQALLANVAAMYAVYHGPGGLRAMAGRVHGHARALEASLASCGLSQRNAAYFDTVRIDVPTGVEAIRRRATAAGINLRYVDEQSVCIALDETVSSADVEDIVAVMVGSETISDGRFDSAHALPPARVRTSAFLTAPVFSAHRSETQMLRYIRSLERKDIGLDRSMIPLGSCTMKLNAATEMRPVTWPQFSRMHPFAPMEQAAGYRQILGELETALCEITGFRAVSLQPNSGAQGELAGLMVIRAYHRARGETHRTVVLIPASAHGTNPASCAMVGMQVVVVASTRDGDVDLEDLRRKAATWREQLAALMITYPSTHGVFEDHVRDVCAVAHQYGAQVYMDGANMNAQVGLTNPASIGADLCHLNLHKTFAIPHGGGGPGMGPIAVAEHLAPYLPGHWFLPGGPRAIHAVSAAPFGSASILLISYGYLRLLGAAGLTEATRYAILNANYIKARLERHFPVLYARENGRVGHELIFDVRGVAPAGLDETDVAKRLIDFGFHAPTISFPVAGTLMVEPTESEDQGELDRFCDAMAQIRRELDAVATRTADPVDNVLRNAPHTALSVAASDWSHPYTREAAAFPLPFVRDAKFWPSVGRIDDAFGDRNLCCAWPVPEGTA
jgi:glycine dehydrogenase